MVFSSCDAGPSGRMHSWDGAGRRISTSRRDLRSARRGAGVAHDALYVDHEHRSAVEAEGPEDPVGLPYGLVAVGEQREGEPTLLAGEVVVALDRLGAHRQHLGAGGGEGVDVLAVGV